MREIHPGFKGVELEISRGLQRRCKRSERAVRSRLFRGQGAAKGAGVFGLAEGLAGKGVSPGIYSNLGQE